MFIDDLRKEFYLQLLGKKILLMADFDVDSLCTCKILQRLFRDDGVMYVIKPVNGIDEMRQTFLKFSHSVDVVILINCGVTLDLQELLGNPVKPIYVIDSHRPVHVLNVYEESKLIRVVVSPEETVSVPPFDELFRSDYFDPDEEDEEEEDEMEDDQDADTPGVKRKRSRADPAERRMMKEWEQKRREIIYEYSKYTSYGTPAALTTLELAWKLSKDQTDIIWWAAVSLTEAFLLEKMPRATYLIFVTQLQDHIARVSHAQSTPIDFLKVLFENEFSFLLYRHWNMYDSIRMTPYCAARFRSWCYSGEQRYHEFLADAGLPLNQVKQNFSAMDLQLRRKLKDIFCSPRIRSKYHFEDITIGTFTAQIGYQNKYSALDIVFGALATLESPDMEVTSSDKFMKSLDFLNNGNVEKTEVGLNRAKELITAVYKEVQTICGLNQLLVFGSFMCVQIQSSMDLKYYSQPNTAKFLVQFVAKAVVANRKDRQLHQLPMVIIIPQDDEWNLVIGIPPLAVDTTKSILGRAFEQVHKNMKDFAEMDNFDPCVIRVQAAQKQLFLDNLLLLLM